MVSLVVSARARAPLLPNLDRVWWVTAAPAHTALSHQTVGDANLLHPNPKTEKRLHKKKRLVQVRPRSIELARVVLLTRLAHGIRHRRRLLLRVQRLQWRRLLRRGKRGVVASLLSLELGGGATAFV